MGKRIRSKSLKIPFLTACRSWRIDLARQYRYEPPPEFPLASPYAGIVHHLSGPNRYALTQIFQKISRSVDGAVRVRHTDVPPEQAEPAFTFIAHQGFSHLNTRIYVRLLGPCFKTGELKAFCQHLEEVSG